MESDLYYIFIGFKQTEPMVLFEHPKTEEELSSAFKKLAKRFHPDLHALNKRDQEWSTKIFTLLSEYRDEVLILIKEGYSPDKVEVRITLNKREIVFTDIVHNGDLGLIIRSGSNALRILRDPEDIDLYDAAFNNLNLLRKDDHFKKYLPGPYKKVDVNIKGINHPAHYYKFIDNAYTLLEVKDKYPTLGVRHAIWMTNRVLELLSYTHSKGIANMAVLPRHILIDPKTHGGVLLDWTCSTKGKPTIVADTSGEIKYPDFFYGKPDDVRYADVLMAFDIFKWLVGDEALIPQVIRNFYRNVYSGYYKGRDTIDVYKRFQKAVDQCYNRTYLKFTME